MRSAMGAGNGLAGRLCNVLLKCLRPAILLIGLAACSGQAEAHKVSDSYLALRLDGARAGRIYGQWDISLRDLDVAIGLDSNRDGSLQWEEIERGKTAIADYAIGRLRLSADGRDCKPVLSEQSIAEHADGAYASLSFRADCSGAIERLEIDYRLLFEVDAQHRGLLKLTTADGVTSSVFPADRRSQVFHVGESGVFAQLGSFIADGITHIAIGFDHILFLLALLLPAVMARDKEGRWRPVATLSQALVNVVKIVTAFTLAHSITLSLATMNLVSPPSRWVESLIAASVLITAIDNLRPLLPSRRWLVAFGFGLIHGFGFAAVLLDLHLTKQAMLVSLVGFNLGVEIGQLALVLLVVPLAYALRHRPAYRRFGLSAASLFIAVLSAGWLLDRSLDLQFMPF